MSEQQFLVDVQLNQNEVKQMVIEIHAAITPTTPAGAVEGQVGYSRTSKTLWFFTGAVWSEIGGVLSVVGDDNPISVVTTSGIATITIKNAIPTVGGSTGANDPTFDGSMTGKDKEKLNSVDWNAADDQTSDEVSHTPAGTGSSEGAVTDVEGALHNVGTTLNTHVTATNPHNTVKINDKVPVNIPSTPSGASDIWADEKQIVTYVTGLVGTTGRPPEPYDPTPGTYPPTYGGGAIKKGDHFIITIAGTLGPATAKPVAPNDSVIANQDAATNSHAQWTVIAATVSVPDGTTARKGITRLSTKAEVDAILTEPDPGSIAGETDAVITPYDLQYYNFNLKMYKSKTSPLTASATKQVTVATGWNNKDVTVQVYDTIGNNLIGQVTRNPDNVKVDFNTSPARDWYVTVSGLDKS